MKRLIGEIIQNSEVVKSAAMIYGNHKEFFIALVSICEDLSIDIPFWTLREDRMLERSQEVHITLNNHIILKISSEDLSKTTILK